MLQDVSLADTSTTILGKRRRHRWCLPRPDSPAWCTPKGSLRSRGWRHGWASPTHFHDGDYSIEGLAAAAPGGSKWFQLYLWRDRQASREFVARAWASGYEALVLTVDTPVAGPRLRDVRNGLTIPPSLSLRTFAEGSLQPAWWFDLMTTKRWSSHRSTASMAPSPLAARMFDPAATIADLAWLRSAWDGPLVVKGIQTVDDARAVVDAGADALIVSNHGGRQLDRAPTPLEVLPAVVHAVGDRAEVYIDGGISSGTDIVAAVAFGARAALVGRSLPLWPDGRRRTRCATGRRHPP